jgi:ubiquitin C-terminal hydrolase
MSSNYGLDNFGNTCYINAIIQSLFKLPLFTDFLNSDDCIKMLFNKQQSIGMTDTENLNNFNKTITYNLYALYNIFVNNTIQIKSIKPYTLRQILMKKIDVFNNSMQQDAHEALIMMMEFIHEEISQHITLPNITTPLQLACKTYWSNYSPIYNLFHGMYYESKQCSNCNHSSIIHTPNICLSLDIPKFKTTVEQINYANYMHIKPKTTTISMTDEEVEYMCQFLPERIKQELDSHHMRTSEKKIEYSLDECIDEYIKPKIIQDVSCSNCNTRCDSICTYGISSVPKILIVQFKRFSYNGHKEVNKIKFEKLMKIRNITQNGITYVYKLCSMINHCGVSVSCGHYYSVGYSNAEQKWFKYDDEIVKKANIDTVNRAEIYIMFYQLLGEDIDNESSDEIQIQYDQILNDEYIDLV